MPAPNVSLDSLRTLHRIHRQLSDLRGRLQRGPRHLQACEAGVKHREEQLAKVQAEAKTVRVSADAKQLQLKTGEGKLDEFRRKLNAAESNREYQILKDQIAAQQMTNSVLEDEILEAFEKVDQFEGKLAEAQDALLKARQQADKVREEVQQQEPLIQGDLARLQAELREHEAALPPPIKEVYERVVRQRGEDALAAVENEFCSGCHTHVPLNVYAEISLSHPMFCKTCGRLLYIPEGAPPPSRTAHEE